MQTKSREEEILIDILVNGTYDTKSWGARNTTYIGKSYLTNEMSVSFVFNGEIHCVYSNLLYDDFEGWERNNIETVLTFFVRTGKIREYLSLSML